MKSLLAIFLLSLATLTNAQNLTFYASGENQSLTCENVEVGTESIWAVYPDAEFLLLYCGEVVIEIQGKERIQIPANVYPEKKGVYIAEIGDGQYVRVNTFTGIATMDKDGEFRMWEYRHGN